MECDIRDRLFWAYATAVDEWQRAVAELPDPPVESWAQWQPQIEACRVIRERAAEARAAFEAHRKEHGC
jgi:hypothetical protein